MDRDATSELGERVRAAAAASTPLELFGSGSKAFYGRPVRGERFSLREHCGIIDYDPQELVLTARSGTPLAQIQALLGEHGQHLAFDPPHFGPHATLGGTIACGIAGPARASAGSARDFVLGVRVLTGSAEALRFGGQVMKNVAGYDVARLMVGALGTLGVLLEVSMKVLPQPPSTMTLMFALSAADAVARMNDWALRPLPVSATCWLDGQLRVRLSGSAAALAEAHRRMGGQECAEDAAFWLSIREHTHPFFEGADDLWRLSVPPCSAPLDLPGRTLLEWGGAQRWLKVDADAAMAHNIRRAVSAVGGHATLFRGGDKGVGVFQ
ncbi:MAG TPA: glycolate oxidase subunit GlcE, partial [Steroidobacteraceae bacterium]